MFRSRKEALASIVKRSRKVGDATYDTYDAYLGTDPVTREPKRMFDRDRKRLEARISEYYASLRVNGFAGQVLTPQQIFDAQEAYSLISGAKLNMSIRDVVKAYIDGEALKKADTGVKETSLSDAYNAYLASFSEIQDQHRKSIASRVGPFVARNPSALVSSVTYAMVAEYLDSNGSWAPKTWNNAMLYIKSFFAWCCASTQGYAAANPMADAKRKPIKWQEPEYMQVESAIALARLLEGVVDEHPDYLSLFVLSFFCGMRTAEIERMPNDKDAVRVNLEDETVRVAKPKGYQKGIRPRSFQIPENALAWMRSFDFIGGVSRIDTKTRRYIGMLAKKNGLAIPDNAGRHSFITYHVAAFGDPSKTEGIVGTSTTMRCSNYMGLASRRDGLAYFGIMPSSRTVTSG